MHAHVGLPHMHCLIILDKNDKPRCRADIDKFVRAEIPDADIDPVLHEIILKHNVHNPCKEGSPCWVDGKCSKNFPKSFQEETKENVDGYPVDSRRNTGKFRKTDRLWVDNSWVVPYNGYLSKKFNCHINVEICSTVKAVKYIFKYIYKVNISIMNEQM